MHRIFTNRQGNTDAALTFTMKTNDPTVAILLLGDCPRQECADGAQSLCILSPVLSLNPREASGKRAGTQPIVTRHDPIAFQVKGPVFESDIWLKSLLVTGLTTWNAEKAGQRQHNLHDDDVALDISFDMHGLWKGKQDMLSSGQDATTAG